MDVHFDGEALSRAAITRMEKVILDVELRSGIARTSVQGLATHQPNPRLVTLLGKQLALPPDKFPPVARTFGNLGSSTCGAALDAILQSSASSQAAKPGPIFLASLGPGLLYGGGWLTPTCEPSGEELSQRWRPVTFCYIENAPQNSAAPRIPRKPLK